MALTAQQELFCQEYVAEPIAKQAAIKAGYSKHTAKQQGQRLLTNVDVKARIAELRKAREERTGITQDWALERLKREAEFEGEGSSHAARVSALSLAMKHLGMLKEDAPHPDRQQIDLSKLTDAALDRLAGILAPLFAAGDLGGGPT